MRSSTASALFLALSVVSAIPHQHRGNIPCYEDNTLRALERFASDASSFCPKYLASAGVPVPSNFAQIQPSRLSSACNCFESTAGTVSPTTAATMATSATTASENTATVKNTAASVTAPVMPASSTTAQSSTASVSSATGSVVAPVSTSVATGGATGGTAKRGLVYDYNSKNAYANFFTGSQYISFASNWGDTRVTGNGITVPDTYAFVPTVRVDGNLQSADWNDAAKTAIQSGSKYLFASNEPDNAGQANLSPQDTATVYKRYMQPFKGQALLATPAVTNGGGATGLNFLGSFLDSCSDCHFDIINIHHYLPRSKFTVDQAVSALKTYIETDVPALQAKYTNIQNIPIMIGEFWLSDASLDEGGTYLEQIMPYLDANPNIIGYQAFGGLWTGNFINSDGTGLTPAGTAYKNYYKAA